MNIKKLSVVFGFSVMAFATSCEKNKPAEIEAIAKYPVVE